MVVQSGGGLGGEMEGYRLRTQCGQNTEGVLLVGGGAKTPSKYHLATLERGTALPNAHIRPCDELMSHSRVYPECRWDRFQNAPRDPGGDRAHKEKEKKKEEFAIKPPLTCLLLVLQLALTGSQQGSHHLWYRERGRRRAERKF